MDEFIVKANLITSFVNVVIMIFIATRKKKKRKSKLPKCDCSDVNECSKWCYAKESFNKDFNDGKI